MIAARSGRTDITNILLEGEHINLDIQENVRNWMLLAFPSISHHVSFSIENSNILETRACLPCIHWSVILGIYVGWSPWGSTIICVWSSIPLLLECGVLAECCICLGTHFFHNECLSSIVLSPTSPEEHHLTKDCDSLSFCCSCNVSVICLQSQLK